MSEPVGALSGITVLDLTRVLAGPYCTQMLGDLGADVIKIERPGAGDDTRRFAPPFMAGPDGGDSSESAYFMSANRNKRSVEVDLTSETGQALVRELAMKADVIVENFKTGNLAKYGLGYDDLKDENPKLVYCSITGFGQTGPYAARPGYDFLIQGMGGIMSLTGEAEGEPQKVGVPIADIMSGMFAGVAVNAALRHAAVTGQGQYIDIGMLDTQVAWLVNQGMNFLHSGQAERLGNAHPNIVPYQVFETADGHIVVAVGNDTQFRTFAGIIGEPELADQPLFATNDSRVRNRDEVVAHLQAIMKTQTSAHWLAELEANKIGCGPINTLDQVFEDPHVKAREMVVNVPHPLAGPDGAQLIASPLKLSETPVQYRHHPPLLGQHTDEVLREVLGYDDNRIAELRDAGAIG
ncbi:MAG: CoA transferase [Rhodospirillaceae bacterium]|jgi:crotonobetainyl-CoA:carnitine CoA-transferase CaiB-like acyl-CoA transferase|nr:CoA transferase [Rhodospirillaceae bacterium]MBT3810905.1 CoA transferase [Rhodospirillaceae bacterium]MBT3930650.1 CoA transferase [Rhodospirillaceae bacterium]MBT4771182.1 CoA transferase [Rhodospirillaceae bacterium]MBT5357805.1 CoA transferase [Rhodospirillaceae bacterium]